MAVKLCGALRVGGHGVAELFLPAVSDTVGEELCDGAAYAVGERDSLVLGFEPVHSGSVHRAGEEDGENCEEEEGYHLGIREA